MSTAPDPVAPWRALLEQVYGGRDWILAGDILVTMLAAAKTLRELGAGQMLCIGGARGAGELPAEPLGPEPIDLGVTADDMMTGIRAALDALADLPPEALARVEAFDPEGAARCIGTIFDDGRPVGGRAKLGARPQRWQALEDKTVIDALWAELGVPHSPHRLVPAELAALTRAHEALDQGQGTVWAGDNREGFHGAGAGTRWVRRPEELAPTAAWLRAHHDQARVMPFLEGIPCSIHGIVFPDYVIALRPCEMLVFRREGEGRFQYASAATYWDPPEADRQQMRALAKRVGAALRDKLGYRGSFTIDGVLTAEGFRPTELNPRVGAALNIMLKRMQGFPLMLFNTAVVEHPELDWRPQALEALMLESADEARSGGPSLLVDGFDAGEGGAGALVREAAGWRVAEEGEPADATYMYGPTSGGVYVRASLVPERTPIGPSAAPRCIEVLEALARHLKLPLAELQPAVDQRSVSVKK